MKLLECYKKFRHKITYIDEYYRRALLIVLILLLVDLILLYLVW